MGKSRKEIFDEGTQNALRAHLEPGEELRHWAFGNRSPSLWLRILLPAIAVTLWTKYYVVGLTDKRFLALRVSGKARAWKILEVQEFSLRALPAVVAKTGWLSTQITIKDPQHPFSVQIYRGVANNRQHAIAMEAALTKKMLPA